MKFLKQNAKEISDEKLVGMVVKGDQTAYAELVDRHMTPVFRLSYSMLNDTGRAEDITQETFMTLWQQAEKWKPSGQVRSWLFRIARNKSIDDIRRIKPHSDIEKTPIQDEQKSPYAHTFDNELTTIINLQIQKLPNRQKEAITLVHFLDCSNIEAAEIMDVSVDALESLLARGRKTLRTLLNDDKDILLKGEI